MIAYTYSAAGKLTMRPLFNNSVGKMVPPGDPKDVDRSRFGDGPFVREDSASGISPPVARANSLATRIWHYLTLQNATLAMTGFAGIIAIIVGGRLLRTGSGVRKL
jgi:hypothetical protein